MLRLHRLFSCKHFIRVAPDRIDLTVMYDETIRMGPFPARIGIRGETGMDDGNGRFILFILQIRKESTELPH